MALTHKHRFTISDYEKLPEDKRYELIDGELFMCPAPAIKRQRISRKVLVLLCQWVEKHDLGEVFPAPTNVVFFRL